MALIKGKGKKTKNIIIPGKNDPVSWSIRTQRLHLCSGVRLPQRVPGYDTKQSDGEALVMLEIWGLWNILLLPSLPGPLWPEVIAPDRVL